MPIYEYECKSCGQITEAIQKMSDKPLRKCPNCGGKVGKLMSMNTFHLKGSGWYVTDYAGKNASTAKSSEKAEKKTETKSSDSSSDKSKPKSD